MRSQVRLFVSLLIPMVSTSLSLASHPQLSLPSDTSTIVVVGTVHNATKYYDAAGLTGILDRVRPDLILVELDSSFFESSMALKPEFVDISLENRVVSAYVKSHSVPIRPYDIEGRNQIYEQHDYFKLQRGLSAALNAAEQANLLGSNATYLLDAIRRFDRIGGGFGSERPEVINSAACDAAMESKQYYAGEGMVQIVSSVPSLTQFVDFAKFKRDFWVQRNETMVRNIMHWAKMFPGRRILVLCGYEHRYYLLDGLKKGAEGQAIVLKEYWRF